MTLGHSDDGPLYLKLRSDVAALILDGRFGEGDQLPSVRALAARHAVNPLTVAKAYQSLQDDGYVVVKRGVGMFVAPGAVERLLGSERRQFIDHVWPSLRAHIARLGLSLDELMPATHR